MSPRSPTTAETLRAVLAARLAQVHTCLPGQIESYDPIKQSASVKLTIKNVIPYADGTGEDELDYPVIPDVPVAHPRAGAWRIHLPLSQGDHVMVMFAERSLDQWRSLGGIQNPLDLRSHDLSDAVAVPCNLYPDADALTGLLMNCLSIGKQGGSVININDDGTVNLGSAVPIDAAALASKVAIQLQQLATVFATWVPVPSDGGAALKAALTVLLGTGWPADTGSSKVKIDP